MAKRLARRARRTQTRPERLARRRRKFQHRPLPPLPTEPIHADLIYTTKEAARFLRASERTLEAWRADGSGPKVTRFGRLPRYFGRDLLAFATERRDAAA